MAHGLKTSGIFIPFPVTKLYYQILGYKSFKHTNSLALFSSIQRN